MIETASADQKIAAVANNFWPRYNVAFNAASRGARKLFVPSVERRYTNPNTDAGWLGFSVTIVQNLGSSNTQVTLKYINKDTQNIDLTLGPITLGPGVAVGCNTAPVALVVPQPPLTTPWALPGSVRSSSNPPRRTWRPSPTPSAHVTTKRAPTPAPMRLTPAATPSCPKCTRLAAAAMPAPSGPCCVCRTFLATAQPCRFVSSTVTAPSATRYAEHQHRR